MDKFLLFCWRAWCFLRGSGGCSHPHRWTFGCLVCCGPGDREAAGSITLNVIDVVISEGVVWPITMPNVLWG